MRQLTTWMMAVALLIAPIAAQTSVPKELAALQGTWVIVTANGESVEGGAEITLTFSGDKYNQGINGEIVERGTIKVDASKKPMTIDLNIAEGNDAGKLQLGVIEVSGTTMTGNLGAPGAKDRPATLTAAGAFAFTARKK
ncbi:MAG TPA: TIGR03067 domain-containing protein [Vicinamibacterales bacterium]|jgi:uncharacterized protein (TIGR03067 family)|nr:TIGR03067 domain-containing protein [Vicinamibacterales bacterium]